MNLSLANERFVVSRGEIIVTGFESRIKKNGEKHPRIVLPFFDNSDGVACISHWPMSECSLSVKTCVAA